MDPILSSGGSFFLDCLWQSTLCLGLGWAASWLWKRHPSRAHRILLVAIIAALLTPPLSQVIRQCGWGILERAPDPPAARGSPAIRNAEPGPRAAAASESAARQDGEWSMAAPIESPPVEDRALQGSLPAPRPGAGRNGKEPFLAPAVPLRGAALGAWCCLTLLAAARLAAGFIRGRRLVARSRLLRDRALQRAARAASRKFGLRIPPAIRVSAEVESPVIWCWRQRPVLLVPDPAAATGAHLDWNGILLHELSHWKRRDHLSDLCARFLACLLPWQPLAWWCLRRLGRLAEMACDDWALAAGAPPADYARSLLDLAPQPASVLGLAAVRNRGSLVLRIRRIIEGQRCDPTAGLLWTSGIAAAGTLLSIAVALAQSGPPGYSPSRAAPGEAETAAGRALEVRVIDHGSRKPLGQASLNFDRNCERSSAETDALGRLRIPLPEQGLDSVSICALKEGFAPANVSWKKAEDGAPAPASVILEMKPGVRAGGAVEDEQGKPIAGAAVRLLIEGQGDGGLPFLTEHEEVTDSSGRWRCSMIPAGQKNLRLRLSHPDHAGDRSFRDRPPVPLAKLRDGGAVLRMERGCAVTGAVTGPDGKPVEGADVFIAWEEAFSSKRPQARTGAGGEFTARGLKPGSIALVARKVGFAPAQKVIAVPASREEASLRLGTARELRILVRDARGNPLPDAWAAVIAWGSLRPRDWGFRTDAGGRIAWKEAPRDPMGLDVSRKGFMRLNNVPLEPSQDDVAITLAAPLRVRGKVLDAGTGEPIRSFQVAYGPDFQGTGKPNWIRTTDPVKQVASLPDGTYEAVFSHPYPALLLRAEAPGFRPGVSRTFRPDEGDQTFNFRLEKGKSISGRVRDPQGKPLQGVEVVLGTAKELAGLLNGRCEHRLDNLRAVTDGSGRYSLPEETEPFIIACLHEAGYAEVSAADLEAAGEIRLQPWGQVEGILQLAGRPAAGEVIELEYYWHPGWSSATPWINKRYKTRSGDDGAFIFERVAPGEALISRAIDLGKPGEMFNDGVRGENAYVEVLPGRTARVALNDEGEAIAGRIELPAGCDETPHWDYGRIFIEKKIPLPRERPSDPERSGEWFQWYRAWWNSDEGRAHRRASWSRQAGILSGGTFRIEGVTAGSYRLKVELRRPPGRNGIFPAQGDLLGTAELDAEVPARPRAGDGGAVDLGPVKLMVWRRLRVGDLAPGFSAIALDGAAVDLERLRGKVVLIGFWAAWGALCRAQVPELAKLHAVYKKDARVAMISLSIDSAREPLEKYVREQGMDWLQIFLGNSSESPIAAAYGILQVPIFFLIGPDGRILAREATVEAIRPVIEKALK